MPTKEVKLSEQEKILAISQAEIDNKKYWYNLILDFYNKVIHAQDNE